MLLWPELQSAQHEKLVQSRNCHESLGETTGPFPRAKSTNQGAARTWLLPGDGKVSSANSAW